MGKFDAIVQNSVARALVVLALIIPISVYLGSSPVRRGILYYLGVLAPSIVITMGAGLWTWSWKWFLSRARDMRGIDTSARVPILADH